MRETSWTRARVGTPVARRTAGGTNMKRLWMGAAMLTLLACRTEGSEGVAPGTEKPERRAPAAELKGDAGPRSPPPEAAKPEQHELLRVLATIDAMNQHEIDSAKMAQKQAGLPDVREYAQKLATDHQQAGDAMKKVLSNKKIDLGA